MKETLALAPKSWRKWIKEGPVAVDKCRRQIINLRLISEADQKPVARSKEQVALQAIYDFFQGKRHRFENFASYVTASIIKRSGSAYSEGWLSRQSGDGGWDFVGRLDVGPMKSPTRVIVLGQAKCEALSKPTNGKDIARLVARLRRGWLGVYVTTSYFSEPVQREVSLDRYPVMLISGKAIAEEAILLATQKGLTDVSLLLAEVDARYGLMVRHRDPEDVVFS